METDQSRSGLEPPAFVGESKDSDDYLVTGALIIFLVGVISLAVILGLFFSH